ncbi:hypothetical protein [Parasitella parasitica]|uniref:Uncharacterized protein n=1 Tax=Parasitella parasitica TaxID=35722 RepID=A0A0B7NJ40_9FUNG|nr:hypothetical protein [Parasitella parasitica]
MATIYHEYGPGDETYICPQRNQIRQDSADVQATVRRLSDSEMRRELEQRRRSEAMSERASVLGSVQSMRQGKLPSNEQLDKVIHRLLNSKSIETNKHHMSADGQLLLEDFQDLLMTFQRALQTKNRDELFQSMIYHVRRSEAALTGDTKPGLEGDIQRKEQAKGDVKTGAKAILNIAKLFLFNAQFRGVLEQILNIAQQTLGGVLQQGGKAIVDQADSKSESNSLLGKAASKIADKTGQASSNDQSSLKDSVRNAVAGSVVGAGGSRLASKHSNEASKTNQRFSTGDMNSHLPSDHQDFLMHRFVDSKSSALATDDAGHTLKQDIAHGAVPRPSSAFSREKRGFLNNQSATQPAANASNGSASVVPQHQMFLKSPTEGALASAIPSSTANELKRTESPSSFTDVGKAGDYGQHQEFKHEQFYGNHMGIYDSNMNKVQQSSSGNAVGAGTAAGTVTAAGGDAGSLGMAGYLFNKQDVRSESPSSFADTGPIGNMDHGDFKHEQFYGNHMGVYDSAMNEPKDPLDQISTTIGDLDMRRKLDAAVPKYAPGAKSASDEYIQSRFDAPSGGGNALLHKRFNAAVPHSANAGITQTMSPVGMEGYVPYQQKNNILPDVNRTSQNKQDFLHKRCDEPDAALIGHQTLTPKSHISTGAGYHLNQDNHTVPAKEIVESLRRPNASGTGSHHMEDQVKSHARSFPGQHFMDKLNYTTAPGGALVNPQRRSDQSRNHDGLGNSNVFTTPHSDKYDAAVVGTAGLMAASAADRAAVSVQKPSSSIHQQKEDIGNSFSPSNRAKRSSFDAPHEYYGIDGQRHMDAGSNTRPILSNKEAVRRMSSGEGVDLDAQPTNSNSDFGAASTALSAGAGAAIGSCRSQQDANQAPNKDAQISADKIVNKLKQKTGVNGNACENQDNQDQNSISASEIIDKLKEILITVQKNPEYQVAMSTLMSLFETWGHRLQTGQMDRRRSSAVPIPEQNEYYRNTAAHEAKTIIEDWAQGKSLDPILKQFSEISAKLKQDENLKNLKHKITAYVEKMLQEPGYLSGDESTEEGNKLVHEVRQSALEEYKPQVKSLLHESNSIIKSVSDDPISQKISLKVRDIHDHLWYDSNGHAAFKPQLLNDMRITLIPALIEQIKFVPLPQIIYSDKQVEIAIENMVLQGDTLMPDIFEVKADDYLRFSPKANVNFTNSQSIHVHMTGIQTTMEDVVFFYRRKSGFPKMSDSGVISVATDGAGLRISLRIVSSSVDQRHTFRIDQCHCHIDKLNIKVNHSKHNKLYKVLNPMLTGIVKRQICKAIENKLITSFEKGDAKITEHLIAKRLSEEIHMKDTRRPGLFSHLVSVLNEKVSSI